MANIGSGEVLLQWQGENVWVTISLDPIIKANICTFILGPSRF